MGLAIGNHAVSVSMTIDFTLDVDDEIVATEHVWRTEERRPNRPPHNPPPPAPFQLEFEEDGDVIIPDEEVPLAGAPKTGDSSMAYTVFMLLSVLCLVVVNFPTKPAKRRQRRSFPMN